MNTHVELYSPEELAGLRRKNRIQTLALVSLGVLALAACVTLCVLTRTGNARAAEFSAIAICAAAGWIILYRARFTIRRGRGEIAHAELMLTGERSAMEGVVEVGPDTVRLPGGVMLRTVRVTNGDGTKRISVNLRKTQLLEAYAGERMTLYAVSGYAAAFDLQGGGTSEACARRGGGAGRCLKNILSQLHVYIIWLLLSVFLWGWIFTLVTDAPREKKVTVFVDAYGCEDTALAAALEKHLPGGIRMVQVHAFSYAMFDNSELLAADLYIVRASDAAEWVDSFAPLDAVGFDPDGRELLSIDGTAYGIKIHEAGSGAASGYIRYDEAGAPAEDYYLFFNRDSLHTGQKDTAAFPIARQLLELEAAGSQGGVEK